MASTSYSEDQFLLRVPPELAEKLNAALRDGGPNLDIDLEWKEGRKGTFRVGQETFNARLQDLPLVTETWKTLDGKNLVKSGDIGQVVVVGQNLTDETRSVMGVTHASREAAKDFFKTPIDVPKSVITEAEKMLAKLVSSGVNTAEGNVDTTYEEVWEDDPAAAAGGSAAAAAAAKGDSRFL